MNLWLIVGALTVLVCIFGFVEFWARERYLYACLPEVEAGLQADDKKIDLMLRNGLTVVLCLVLGGGHDDMSLSVLYVLGAITFVSLVWNIAFMAKSLVHYYRRPIHRTGSIPVVSNRAGTAGTRSEPLHRKK